MDHCIEEPLAPTLGALAVTRILLDVGNHTGIENALAIVGGIKAAIKIEIGTSEVTGLNLSHKLSFALSWEPLHRGGPPWHISTREPVPMPSFGTARRSRCQRWKRWNND